MIWRGSRRGTRQLEHPLGYRHWEKTFRELILPPQHWCWPPASSLTLTQPSNLSTLVLCPRLSSWLGDNSAPLTSGLTAVPGILRSLSQQSHDLPHPRGASSLGIRQNQAVYLTGVSHTYQTSRSSQLTTTGVPLKHT